MNLLLLTSFNYNHQLNALKQPDTMISGENHI